MAVAIAVAVMETIKRDTNIGTWEGRSVGVGQGTYVGVGRCIGI